jgi:hypothetical protein
MADSSSRRAPCVCAPFPNQVQQPYSSHQSMRPTMRSFGSNFRGEQTPIDFSVYHRLLFLTSRGGFRPGEPPCVCGAFPNHVQHSQSSRQSMIPTARSFGSNFRDKQSWIDFSVDVLSLRCLHTHTHTHTHRHRHTHTHTHPPRVHAHISHPTQTITRLAHSTHQQCDRVCLLCVPNRPQLNPQWLLLESCLLRLGVCSDK